MDIGIVGGEASIYDFDTKNDITNREYKTIFVASNVFFKYQILEELSLGGGIQFEYYGNIENKISTVGEINALGPYAKMEYKKTTYEYPFEEGIAVRLGGDYQFSLIDDQKYYSIDGEVKGSLVLTEIQRIGGGIYGGYGELARTNGISFRHRNDCIHIISNYCSSRLL